MSKSNIPDKVLKDSGLKVARTPDGKEALVPKAVDDRFQKVLSNIALSGSGGRGSSTSEYLNLFNYYLQNVLETKAAQRLDRYEQMDFIIENDPALALTRRTLVDEVLQMDIYSEPIKVVAEKVHVRKKIDKLFKDLGIKSYLREVCSDLISYGDAFHVLDIQQDKGVIKVIPVDPRDVRHRFEFSLAELKKDKDKIKKKYTSFQIMIDLANTIETNASEFNKVLLGFQILNTVFPFWQVLHYRQFTTRNRLAPFGKPTFYESQSEARMYLNSKVIISMIRSSAFMREHIKVKTGEQEDPASQWEKVQQVKQMMDLYISVSGKSAKDYPSFGEKVYYPDGLIDIEKVEAGYNFRDRFEDLQIMREDVFTSTGLPKEYFAGGEQRQYVSYKTLVSQDKKAARMVYSLQSYIIDQLIKLVEVHFSFTGEFDPYKEDFAISLPYPVPDTDDSVIALSRAKMEYALGVIDSLKTALEVTRIPTDIVRKLLMQYFPFNDEDIDSLVTQMKKDSSEEDKLGYSRIGMKAGDPFLQNKEYMDQTIDAQDQAMGAQDPAMATQGGDSSVSGQDIPPEQQGVDQSSIPTQGSPQTQQNLPPGVSQIASWVQKHDKSPLHEDVFNLAFPVYKSEMEQHYLSEFYHKTKDLNLEEEMEKVMSKHLLSLGEEFNYNFRHYVSNSSTSVDRNITGVSSIQKKSELREMNSKVLKEEDSKNKKVYKRTTLKDGHYVDEASLDEESVISDTRQDRRYKEKKK